METDFEILGHVVADHYRAVVRLREQNTQLLAEVDQLRQALEGAVALADSRDQRMPCSEAHPEHDVYHPEGHPRVCQQNDVGVTHAPGCNGLCTTRPCAD